jgi:NAD(P)-dependent dehydrogenase (short-subunit alcohol dehydrogenase family)
MAVCDIADLQQITQTAETYVERFGAPDVLINNAGYAVYRTVEEMAVEEVDRLLRVNLTGACLLTRAFLPSMIAARRGSVVMVASIAGRLPLTPCGPYGAAKHGMVAFAEILRPEVDRFGLTVHVICPGRVEETDFFEHETFTQRTPRRETRLLTTLDAISRATFDALSKNRFMTYVPRTFGFLVWLNHSFPFLVGPALRRLMRARVESVYAQKQLRDQP